jgi:putative glycosyl hydrolase-like family 15 (GHL15) protein
MRLQRVALIIVILLGMIVVGLSVYALQSDQNVPATAVPAAIKLTPQLTPTRIIELAPALAASPTPQVYSPLALQLAWFYKPPHDGDLRLIAEHFNTFILTNLDEPARDRLKTEGVKSPFLQYLGFDEIQDPGSCSAEPLHNQVANRRGDFCMLRQQHPDWFLRDRQGNLLVERDGSARYVLMDPANSGWREFWLQRVRDVQKQSSWDGVFLDNVEASLAKRKRLGALPAKYPDDESYQAAMEGFLAYLYTNYFRPEGRVLQANIIELEDQSAWFYFLRYLNGAMEERFAVDWTDNYLSADQWEAQMERVEQTQQVGKQVILVAQGSRGDIQRQLFALASYWLVAEGRASFRYSNQNAYDEAWLYNTYNLVLGTPRGPRYLDGDVWKRDYSNGTVSVSPVDHTASIVVR